MTLCFPVRGDTPMCSPEHIGAMLYASLSDLNTFYYYCLLSMFLSGSLLKKIKAFEYFVISTLCEKCPYSELSGPYFPAFGQNTERNQMWD